MRIYTKVFFLELEEKHVFWDECQKVINIGLVTVMSN